MEFSPFALLGGLIATGPGILLLVGLAASSIILWDWRWAIGSTLAVMLSVTSVQAALHSPALPVSASQWLAALVSAALLGIAGHLRPRSPSAHASTNWLVRLIALVFFGSAWWVIDPGVSLPNFTQVETDLLFWVGLCGLLMMGLSASPIFTGTGLLLLTVPTLAIAPILLPGSGVAIILGIGQILLALACAYLTLAEPIPAERRRRYKAPPLLPAATPVPTRPVRRPLLLPRLREAALQAEREATAQSTTVPEVTVVAKEP